MHVTRTASALRRLAPLLSLSLAGCGITRLGLFAAAGPTADGQRDLLQTVLLVLIFVAGPVLILTPIIAWHYRLANTKGAYRPKWTFSWPLEFLIWIPPSLIVVGLSVVVWHSTHTFDPYRRLASAQPALEVQAVGLDFKWLFIYPDQNVAAVNDLAIPAGRPIHLSLSSATVMQSLLIPQLAGQIYAMPGMTTQLNLAADHPGAFRGENTQFNGMGFQNQHVTVHALSPDDFAAWVARARATGPALDQPTYLRLAQAAAPSAPTIFGAFQPGLFGRIIAQFHTAPGAGVSAGGPHR